MTDSAIPAPGPPVRPIRRHATTPSMSATRAVVALLILAIAVTLLIRNDAVRVLEATAVRYPIDLIVPGQTMSMSDVVIFRAGEGDALGIRISFMCSTVVLAAPLLITSAALLPFRRFSPGSVARGLGGALVIVIAANLLRFTLIAFAYATWGREGFDLSHHIIGSVVVILAFIGAFAFLVRTVGRRRRG